MQMTEALLDRINRWWGPRGGLAQFHNPTGLGGRIAGWMMSSRSSNVARNHWAVQLLDVQPTDRILELGCGPGVGVAALARQANRGLVIGVDQSRVMIRQARRRNRAAVRAGRVRLIQAAVQDLAIDADPFDAALAVNTVGMWPEPVARLREAAQLLRPGARFAVVSQPRCPGATAGTSRAAGAEIADMLTAAGFIDPRTELLNLVPPVACVIACVPSQDDDTDLRRQR
jgi:ubiquinone/menaquinone biosynthesis C-methylase UbiE